VNIFAAPLELLRKREAERSLLVGREGADLPANGEITLSVRGSSIFVEHCP